ncbi:PREDICTED: fatty acid synthase-like [Dinoponera quadriceps]|uniref:Fatty acid synthase-like n=1 Tax=Dinoponera quadriceps TaxID=609295 RepID=A0A6P3WZ57_DINQU|nr:PREDICTED: fatty acid synthase-like [Dinoponera quadriceps]
MNQLRLDLPINVLRPGRIWGSYRHFALSLPEPRPVQCGYVVQGIRGDLSTFRCVEGRASPEIKPENLIRIVYAALNFKDAMIATGKLALNPSASIERNVDSLIGLEFVGFDENRRRIMGICPNRCYTIT